jgi:hypothetical protein
MLYHLQQVVHLFKSISLYPITSSGLNAIVHVIYPTQDPFLSQTAGSV